MVKDAGAKVEGAKAPEPPGPLVRLFAVDDLFTGSGAKIEITATAAECDALARQFDLQRLVSLTAELTPVAQGKTLHIAGRVRAILVQTCVVTMEPFENQLEEPVDVRFSGESGDFAAGREVLPGNEAEWDDPPEPLPRDALDLGALVAEHLALGIDPYPRSPGATFDMRAAGEGEDRPDSPFAALRGLNLDGKK